MTIEIQKIIYNHLTIDQMNKILADLEKLARDKHYQITQAYEQDGDISEDLQTIVDDSHWENFLPSQYHALKFHRDEQTKQVS